VPAPSTPKYPPLGLPSNPAHRSLKQLLAIVPASLLLLAAGAPQQDQQDQQDQPPGAAVQHSSSCARCHANSDDAVALRDVKGRPIAPFDLWQSTMMANAARDPLWRAAVAAEVAATPSARVEIESTCLRCHAPMAEQLGLVEHDTGSLMHTLDCESEIGDMARDGVSCTICHGISPEGLGTEASYSAHFVLDPWRRIFGPHEKPLDFPMRMNTGFMPTAAEHITSAALCGSCHTLETETLDAGGKATGHTLLEQAPYLEWRNSSFNNEGPDAGAMGMSCQDCHVPTYDQDGETIETPIAHHPLGADFANVNPRKPVGRHLFVGGNTLALGMLKNHSDELNVLASPDALQATLDATRHQLQTRSVRLAIGGVEQQDGKLRFHVDARNLSGHKFPTAHPTRRAWLRVIVRDASGKIVFASGRADDQGQILDAKGKPLASESANGPVAPHRDQITSGDQVASFQAIMADAEGLPTHTLMRGASWLRDDRILPMGWDPEHPDAKRTEPRGIDGDQDFRAGQDRVHYEIELAQSDGLLIEVSMLYQNLSARWAAEILQYKAPAIERFARLYAQADKQPEVIQTSTWPESADK